MPASRDVRGGGPTPAGPEDRDHLRALARERRRRAASLVTALALLVLLLVFAVRNSGPVSIDFVFFTRTPRLIWVMLASAVAGGVVGFLVGRPGRRFRFHRTPRHGPGKAGGAPAAGGPPGQGSRG